MVLSARSASAPPCAATACFTSSCADCADAGPASIAPNMSATPDATTRYMLSSQLVMQTPLVCPAPRFEACWNNPAGAGLFDQSTDPSRFRDFQAAAAPQNATAASA